MKNVIAACAIATAVSGLGGIALADGDAAQGEKEAKLCASCHKFGEGATNAFGPVLNGVVGRTVGSYPDYTYSPGVQAMGEGGAVWSEEALSEWLADPSAYVQKQTGDESNRSKMPLAVKDEQKRMDIIAFLKTLGAAAAGDSEESAEAGESEGGTVDAVAMGWEDPLADMPRVRQELVAPPFAPEHTQVADGEPKIVEVELVVKEMEWELDDAGTKIRALTYNGSIPAPLIIVHEGDYVELTLRNPSTNLMEHNIDLHAATGALGAAGVTTISPGEDAVVRFKTTKSGAFLYHCAPEGTMTPYHVTHGMTGAIMVLPREGITDDKGNHLPYDRLYYVGENEFYVPKDENGEYKTYAQSGDDFTDWVAEMRKLIPSHVVFNGRAGALTGKDALKANVGESVLFLHMQGNRDTRPHLIGGHGDYVWETGTFESPPLKDMETWFIRGGSVGAAHYTFIQPGVYVYLNHNLIEAVELGAAAHVVVDGEWNEDIMKQLYKGPIR